MLLLAATMAGAPQWRASAQTRDSLLLRDYGFVANSDAWLDQPNAAALTRFAHHDIVQAEASLTTAHGHLTDYYEAPTMLQATLGVESYCRLSQRTVGFGSISYDNFTGRQMTGSAFIDPTRMPFDIVEATTSNAGTKHRDTYQLTGAVGYQLTEGLSAGLRLDYLSANYAKYKDLRHKNERMALDFSVGLYASPTAWLHVGADYRYLRRTESVGFNVYGKTDRVYQSLISYGAFMGLLEQFGNDGYTDKTREMPLFEDGSAVDLQVEVVPAARWSVLATVGLTSTSGYYGRRSPYTITYTGHDRDRLAASMAVQWTPAAALHRIEVSVGKEETENRANNFRALTNNSGATYYEYFDPVETARKQWFDASVSYRAHWGISHEQPRWTVTAGSRWARRRTSAYVYPDCRQQQVSRMEWQASGRHQWLLRSGVLGVAMQLQTSNGWGAPSRDILLDETGTGQGLTASGDDFLCQEWGFLTSRQYGIGVGASYRFRIPTTRVAAQVGLHADHRTAPCWHHHRSQLTATVGATF